MTKYLRVDIDTPYGGEVEYVELDDGQNLTQDEIAEYAQEVMNNRYSCGGQIVDESDVPEYER